MPARTRFGAAACLLIAQPLAPLAAPAANEAVTLEELSVEGEGRGGRGIGAAPDRPSQVEKKIGVAAPPGSAALPIERPVGQIVTAVGREAIGNRPATSIGSVLLDSPGVTVRQGNGGRDVVVSIRGNNARSTGVTRNMVVLEDGFPVTQADGASRFDLVDPRAYSRIDVFRGPQSALFGNYATGGALAFRTRTGREIDGFEVGIDAGSYGYLSNYFTVGGARGPFEISLFASDVRGDGYQQHANYDTQTVNLLASYTPTPDNRFTLKVINNALDANIPGRSSLDQFRINPYQRGCDTAPTAAPGCATFTLGGVAATAAQAGFRRNDRRTIVAGRFEHDIDAQTTWRVQVGFDERNYDQPFYTSSGRGSLPSYNFLTDLTRRGEFFGLPATAYVALAYSAVDVTASTFTLTPFGGARLGPLLALQDALQSNLGGRARLELELSPEWTAVTGLSAERSAITGRNRTFPVSPTSLALADRSFLNVAPELALVYRPDPAWALRGRVATGYATPSFSSLFVTPEGVPGNNTGLKTQENLGFDLGAEWVPVEGLRLSLTGFYELFRNEFVTQSPGAGLLNYTFNAPASEHRGIEVAANWAFAPGWNGVLAYTFDDQVYTDYVERLSVRRIAPELPGGFENVSTLFNRAGNRIPGVPDHQLLARIGYDVPAGPLAGLGGFAEVVAQGGYSLDNSNLLKVPGFAILNLNVHYAALLPEGYAKRIDLYGEVRNVLDTAYVSSANPLANSLSRDTGLLNGRGVLASTVGSIYAGAPRTFVAGMKLSF